MTGRLIEPMALLHGAAARAARAEGLALPLMGGPAAFALCRLIERDLRTAGSGIVAVRDIPPAWAAVRDRITAPPPAAGLRHAARWSWAS